MLVTTAKILVRILPSGAAVKLVIALASRSRRPPVSPQEQALLDQAQQIRYGPKGENVAWSWGTGPVVILVHGWNGRASQMAPLAKAVADAGFRAVAIDITGHGSSPGRTASWTGFIRDVSLLSHALGGEVHAWIGHSAGGLALMAARAAGSISARRYACIAAPSYPFPPVEVVSKTLAPPQPVIRLYQQHLADQFAARWDALVEGAAYAGAGRNLLLVYDEKDRFVNHTEGDRIAHLCPGAHLFKTQAYSHTRILAAPETMTQVLGFLRTGDGVEFQAPH